VPWKLWMRDIVKLWARSIISEHVFLMLKCSSNELDKKRIGLMELLIKPMGKLLISEKMYHF